MVLKVSAIEGDEPQTLAQLQHTSIVPIYSVHEDHAAGLRSRHALLWRIESRKRLAATLANLNSSPQGERFVEALKAADASVGGDTEARPRPGRAHHGRFCFTRGRSTPVSGFASSATSRPLPG